MSNNFLREKKPNNKKTIYYLSSKTNKTTKKAISQRKYYNSPDIITQMQKPNYYPIRLLPNNYNNLNINYNSFHQQAFTPLNRRNKLYEEEPLLPDKSSKFEGKKTLVLDIDETLVHSSFFPFEKNDLVLNVNFDGIFYNIYVLVRPGVEQFIKNISKYFEVITFTASIPAYASPLLDILDKERNIQHRLYREHCTFVNGVFVKDLKRLNRNLKDVIIVDNSPLAFAFDSDNGLPILSWFDDPIDKELMNIQPLLEFLANTKDVRKYIKKFVKNNNINYEMAKKIIRENKINKNNIDAKDNKNNKDNKDIQDNKENKDNKDSKNESKIKNNENENKLNNDMLISSKDISIKKENDTNEKEDDKNILNNNANNNNDINNNKSKTQTKLLNNFIINKDSKIPIILDENKKNNNIKPIVNNKINNLIYKNKDKEINNPSNLKLEFSNINSIKYSEDKRKKSKLKKNNSKNYSNNKKNNIFRLGLKINENNNNNLFLMNKNYSPQYKFKNDQNIENDFKINDNNSLMPTIISSSSFNTSKNKNKNYFIQYNNNNNNIQNNNNIKIISKQNDIFGKNNNYGINNSQSLSLKETIEDKYKSIKHLNNIDLMEKYQNNNKLRSSSLKAISNKDEFNMKNNNKFIIRNSKNNNLISGIINNNKLEDKSKVRASSKNNIRSIYKENNLNNFSNRNNINNIFNNALRSKSTGNSIKLKSAHVKSTKNNMNQFLNNNLKWFNEEENKLFLRNNKF